MKFLTSEVPLYRIVFGQLFSAGNAGLLGGARLDAAVGAFVLVGPVQHLADGVSVVVISWEAGKV